MYGFCIKCGHEFPKIEAEGNICPLCQYPNPDEADYCVKCGTPLIFKKQFEGDPNSAMNPIVIKKEVIRDAQQYKANKTSKWLIIFGYVFSILGGILGLIIAIYLSTRKDPNARKHGHIQLAIFAFYIVLIAIMFATGNMPADAISQYQQMLAGNFTSI
jgi:ribosomal protein L40E